MKPTHFLSIPLSSVANRDAYSLFRARIIENYDLSTLGINETCFLPEAKLHYTLFVMRLSEEALPKARQLLRTTLEGYTAFNIHTSEMNCFPLGKSTNCRVLFLRPKPKSLSEIKLQEVAQLLLDAYFVNGLLNEIEYKKLNPVSEKINFHVSLINMRYLKVPAPGGKRNNHRLTRKFDCSAILADEELSLVLPDGEVSTVLLSSMRKPVDRNSGYYHSEEKAVLAGC